MLRGGRGRAGIAREALAEQQRELQTQAEELAAQLRQREPTTDDIEEVGTTSQMIMSLSALCRSLRGARFRDVCLRVENELALLDTKHRTGYT